MFFDDWQTNERYKNSKIRTSLLWEYDLTKFDWHKMRAVVVERIIKLGHMSDFYAGIRFYGGLDDFTKIIRDEVTGLNSEDISFVKNVFHIKEEELYSEELRAEREKELGFKASDFFPEWVW